MTKKWEDIPHKARPEQREQARHDLEAEYNRLYWQIVRFWDRIRGRWS